MRKVNSVLLCFIIFINSFIMTGCWNYREVESLAIVAGVAVDKGENTRYSLTVEVVKISGGKDAKIESKLISVEGDTMFDCARNAISLSGKKLYWSHNKILIISKEIAQKGVLDMIDWFNRDSETRANIHIVVSTEKSAADILNGEEVTESIKSYELDDMLKNEEKLSKAPQTEIWEFANNMAGEGINASVATIKMKASEKGKIPAIGGAALFKGDKLIGLVDEEEAKDILFLQDRIKGGLLIQEVQVKGIEKEKEIPISLEIFKSKTKVKPVVNKDKIKVNVDIETTVTLAEVGGSINLIDEKGRKALLRVVETTLEKRIENTSRKIQRDFGSDVFGFGKKIYEDKNKSWQKVKNNWNENFKNIEVKVTAKVHIKNSAMLLKPLEVKEK